MSDKEKDWRVVKRPSQGINIEWGEDDKIVRPICHMRWTDGLNVKVEEQVMKDAQRIVHCVNNYDKLYHRLQCINKLATDYTTDYFNITNCQKDK